VKIHSQNNEKSSMKNLIIGLLFLFFAISFKSYSQEATSEKYGKTLNLGLGIGGYAGYYSYAGRSLPVFHLDYEFDVAQSFTLAPFINVFSFSQRYYWGNNHTPYKYYNYRETVIPVGVKGTYYFDKLLKAHSDWDFYLAGSAGFAIINSSWDNDYYGDKNHYKRGNPLFLDLHIGAEYHINNRIGVFLDLSSGVSTIGIAIH